MPAPNGNGHHLTKLPRLTPKMQALADAYLLSFNGTKAAKKAGFKGNDVTLASVAYEYLRKPQIVSYLSKKFEQLAEKSEKAQINAYEEWVDSLEVLKELKTTCLEWLRVNGKMDLDHRADEVRIVYHDPTDKTALKWPKQKKASVQQLINEYMDPQHVKVENVIMPAFDMRKYILELIDRIDVNLDKFARMGGNYVKDADNPANEQSAASWIKEFIRQRQEFALNYPDVVAAHPELGFTREGLEQFAAATIKGEAERLGKPLDWTVPRLLLAAGVTELGGAG